MELNVTFLFQLGFFLFTVIVLSNVAFGPILKTLDERSRRIEGAQKEAAALQSSSSSQAGVIEQRMADARKAGQDELNRLKGEGEKVEAEAIAAARAQAAKQIEEAKVRIQKASETARGDLKNQASVLAGVIVEKALGRQA
ncbi:MAG: ATP synthase F0 subunit B [Myxococcota bacterium]